MVERGPEKAGVGGSIPSLGILQKNTRVHISVTVFFTIILLIAVLTRVLFRRIVTHSVQDAVLRKKGLCNSGMHLHAAILSNRYS
jgi:hypothetical protein